MAAQAFQSAGKQAAAESRQMKAKAQEVKNRCDDLLVQLDDADPRSMLTQTTGDAIAGFQANVLAASLELRATQASMRSLQFTANQRIASTTRLYQVAPGDTLESIAALKLGSPARAGDLGIRPQDLRPGRLIRLPL
jgi:hypothetical protein